MLCLKEDNVEAFLTLLGTELYTLGPIYLSECFPKERLCIAVLGTPLNFPANELCFGISINTQVTSSI